VEPKTSKDAFNEEDFLGANINFDSKASASGLSKIPGRILING
jgi:hypothetical protein